MKLHTLTLRNFAGVRDHTLQLDGSDATIRGTNASGKTTRFTAFTWLLFGKDARGQAQFDIKTIGADGEPLHNLEHTVEGTFSIGDELVTLRKTLVEVWTRKRGSSTDEFTGHRVDHYIDGVPVQKKEYDQRISQIAPEGTFRLLTDPDAFHALHWQERRKVLLDVCGDVTDGDVIASDPDLAELPRILGKRSLEEHRKVVDARRKEINRELQAIPVRIDEATNGRPALPAESREKLEANLATLRDARTALEQQRARLEAGGAIAELQAKAREVDGKLADVARSVTASDEEALATARRERARLEDEATRARRAHALAEHDLDAAMRRRIEVDETLITLRGHWAEINERQAPHTDVAGECPACHQALPAEQITAAHARALEEWNAKQAAELEAAQARGQAARRELDTLTARIDALNEAVASAADEAAKARAAEAAATARVDDLAHAIPDPTRDAKHQVLTAERARLEEQIASVRAGSADTLANLRDDTAKLDAEIRERVQAIGAFDLATKATARVDELAQQEKLLATEFEDLERQLHLMDAFTRAKAGMLTDRINSRFAITRWRLFDTQINGGLVDACTATVDGVPYGTGLNRAGRINSGLDVIRVLQEHHAFFPPVWIDECESVVDTLPLDAQTIRLVVDARHPTLTVEIDATQEVHA
jgi:hypothetical protein